MQICYPKFNMLPGHLGLSKSHLFIYLSGIHIAKYFTVSVIEQLLVFSAFSLCLFIFDFNFQLCCLGFTYLHETITWILFTHPTNCWNNFELLHIVHLIDSVYGIPFIFWWLAGGGDRIPRNTLIYCRRYPLPFCCKPWANLYLQLNCWSYSNNLT